MTRVEVNHLIRDHRALVWRDLLGRHRPAVRIKRPQTLARNLPRIFEAALEISNRRGFAAMTMRDLSAETGLSLGALYAYFSSKDELLTMLQETGRTITRRVLTAALEGVVEPREKLRAAIKSHLYLSEAMRPWFYFSYMEAKHLGPEEKSRAVAGELETEKLFADIIAAGRRAGVFDAPEGALTASMIKALVQDWYVKRAKHARRRISVDRYAQAVIALVEAYLTTPRLSEDRP
ncbi:MAG: TetR/AcrR family transcriptional regulator [Proteobacteria bacterium]|nr:TetR/AcrR family transcriptional regulator [Pseudomonadota bacterium]MBU1742470.1 TetR/AcrR family transcriptional regulator [Pseudomonadota bacterium]